MRRFIINEQNNYILDKNRIVNIAGLFFDFMCFLTLSEIWKR